MIKNQKDVIFENCCGAIYDESELAKAVLWYSAKPIYSRKKVFLYGRYPAVSLYNEKIHIHRLLAMFWLGGKISDDFHVHHIDGNKLNATRENLVLVPSETHLSYHNAGKTLSVEHRRKIGDRNRERRGTRYKQRKPNITPQMVYGMRISGMSFNKISKMLELDWGCVKQRYEDFIHDNPELLEGGEEE